MLLFSNRRFSTIVRIPLQAVKNPYPRIGISDKPCIFLSTTLAFLLPSNSLYRFQELKSMPKPMVSIEKWAVVKSVSSQGFEKLHPGNRLVGYVAGHERIANAQLVYTSPIVSIDLNQGTVETHNTMYRLGEANNEYMSWENKRRASTAA
jgi:hypothetical protein